MILLLPVLLTVHVFLLSQLTFTAWPEMLAYPYLLVNGFTLYKDYIMPYPPGLVFLLSGIFQTFGFSVEVLKILTWALILVSDAILFVILKKVTGKIFLSFIFLGVYIILQAFLDGNMLWFDFAMVIPLLGAFWFGLKWLENFALKDLFLISFFLSMAILIKQTAGIYLLGFGILYLFVRGARRIREIWVVGGGIAATVVPLIIYLAIMGSLAAFLNWALLYPLTEWSKFPGYVDFNISKKEILVTVLALLPVMAGLLRVKTIVADRILLFTGVFLTAALIAVYPRFSFFHLQPAIPFLVIFTARNIDSFSKKWKNLYGLMIGIVVISIVGLLINGNVNSGIRFYNDNDKKLTQMINENTKAGERIYLLGLNSSQYVFTNKMPPKNWSDNFGWYLEIPGVQDWVIKGFGKSLPEKVFWRIPSIGSWYSLGVYQPKKITDYITQNYHFTDKIEGGIEIWTKNN